MAVPSATPRDIVEQLNGLINAALAAPEVRRRMDEFGLSWDITDLAACEAEVRAERERWTEYTRVAGIAGVKPRVARRGLTDPRRECRDRRRFASSASQAIIKPPHVHLSRAAGLL